MTKWNAYYPAELLAEVDAYAARKGIAKRAEAMRQLLRTALDADRVPEWMTQLNKLAARLNTDAAGAVDVLAEYLEAPDEPASPASEAKPKKGIGTILRSII